ncbi:hypothetical protein NQ314_002734 [Rhamnusium bicolor]|uniref:STAS domain-containing protein n=1 Tax=Rhamnusium bicolor TaxID=1586634 RepID=A0AAV8ZNY7_9CUCU|nr:hypothetical protein NQ314_002734 [Rhamnusium bicolor]
MRTSFIAKDKQYVKVTPTSSILFSSAEYVRDKILRHNLELGKHCETIVIDCHRINKMDFTSGMVKSTHF